MKSSLNFSNDTGWYANGHTCYHFFVLLLWQIKSISCIYVHIISYFYISYIQSITLSLLPKGQAIEDNKKRKTRIYWRLSKNYAEVRNLVIHRNWRKGSGQSGQEQVWSHASHLVHESKTFFVPYRKVLMHVSEDREMIRQFSLVLTDMNRYMSILGCQVENNSGEKAHSDLLSLWKPPKEGKLPHSREKTRWSYDALLV